MDFPAYLRILLSVWVGLGLGQLVQATHRLARFRGVVRWDWLPVTWAAFAFLMFVQTWWAYFTILQAPIWLNLFAFLLPLSVFVILYLLCSGVLPDVSKLADDATVDLREHYLRQHRYFFALWGVLWILAVVISSLSRGGLELAGGDGFRVAALVGAATLFHSADRRVHEVVTALSAAGLIVHIVLFSLRLA